MTEEVWNTFDALFKAMHRQGRRVEELEARVVELERRLKEGGAPPAQSHLSLVNPEEEVQADAAAEPQPVAARA